MVGFKKAEYENVPAGSHPFRCFGVIDFGTQEREYQGEHYSQPEVNFLFEFPTELMADGRPFTMKAGGFNFSAKLTSKSKLMRFFKAWLPNEKIDVDYNFKELIGKTGVANVVHDSNPDGSKVYANIASVMPLMKGMEVPAAVNTPIYVSLDDDWSQADFDRLSVYFQDIIKQSPEYNAIMDKQASGMQKAVAENFPAANPVAASPQPALKPLESDEIPF